MKKKMLVALLSWAMILPLMLTTPSNANAQARHQVSTHQVKHHRKVIYTPSQFPKTYRGTWYHYEGHNRYDVIKMGKTGIYNRIYNPYNHKFYADTLRVHRTTLSSVHKKLQLKWVFLLNYRINNAPWLGEISWNGGRNIRYNVAHPRYHGKKVKTLSLAAGQGNWVGAHYYANKRTAKRLGNHHFKGYSYFPVSKPTNQQPQQN